MVPDDQSRNDPKNWSRPFDKKNWDHGFPGIYIYITNIAAISFDTNGCYGLFSKIFLPMAG